MTTTEKPRRGRPALDLAGQRFGRWTVLGRGPNVGIHAGWRCRCDCGTEKLIAGRNLRYGRSKSCGCFAPLRGGRRAERAGPDTSPIPRRQSNCQGFSSAALASAVNLLSSAIVSPFACAASSRAGGLVSRAER